MTSAKSICSACGQPIEGEIAWFTPGIKGPAPPYLPTYYPYHSECLPVDIVRSAFKTAVERLIEIEQKLAEMEASLAELGKTNRG